MLGQTLDVYWAVADTRMLLTLGKDAKARLTAIAAGQGAAPSRTRRSPRRRRRRSARDLFYYLDLDAGAGVVGALAEEQRLAALAKGGGSPIPVDLHGRRRRRGQAVDDGHDRAGGGVHGLGGRGRGGNGRETA